MVGFFGCCRGDYLVFGSQTTSGLLYMGMLLCAVYAPIFSVVRALSLCNQISH